MSTSNKQSGLLGYLFLLTGVFCLLQLSFLFQSSSLYLEDVKFVASHLKIPEAIIPGVLFYLSAQLFLQISYTLIVWALARLTGIALHLSWHRTQYIGFGIWVLTTLFVLFANAFYFSNSKYTQLLAVMFHPQGIKTIYYLLCVPVACVLMLSFLGMLDLLVIHPQWKQHERSYQLISVLLLVLGVLAFFPKPQAIAKDASTIEKPNIIIIGIDALRPDFLSYFGRAQRTPHLDQFLNQAWVFGEALTPLARTFPSWMSILTGAYPRQTNARFDLPEPSSLHITTTLPKILQQNGYETLYGMDDARFSNITHDLGFDKLITPPIGFNDFFLGSFNDFPLSNLVVNTRLGRFLFPYSYGNRGVFITYQPNSYIAMWRDVLNKDRTKPLFLAVHFCLPHYPYFWGGYGPANSENVVVHYSNAVQEMDRQFAAFMDLLKQQNVLQHSMIVLLSDHGEALEFPGDRITAKEFYVPGAKNVNKQIPHFYPPTFEKEAVDQSAGHGTDVLGLSQYHSVLAFALEGMPNTAKPHLVSGIVSLMQIRPTILNYLHLAPHEENGLQDLLTDKKESASLKSDFFLESDFSPEAVRSVHPETKKLLFEGVTFFTIDPKTTRVTIKKSMADMILSSKQYADIYQHWMLAYYPQPNHRYKKILVNLDTGKWTDDLSTRFAENSPYKHMTIQLRNFYGSDIS